MKNTTPNLAQFTARACGELAIITAGILMAVAPLTLTSGCASGPSATERHFFDITTNRVETVQATTNLVEGLPPVVVLTTNVHETYDLVPNERAEALTDSARRVTGLFGPWGEVVGLGVAGLFSLWATMRSKKKGRTVEALAQSIETARQILLTTPQGQELDSKFVQWLKDNQKTTGVIDEVAAVLDKVVDTNDAKKVADTIRTVVSHGPTQTVTPPAS